MVEIAPPIFLSTEAVVAVLQPCARGADECSSELCTQMSFCNLYDNGRCRQQTSADVVFP